MIDPDQASKLQTSLSKKTTLAFIGSLAFLLLPQVAQASQPACVTTDSISMLDRSKSGTTPCITQAHHLIIETGYYQNASQVGGTALAAYPLLHIRYGLSSRTEIFLDPATAIAKSGLNGAGIYTWSRSGTGIRYRLSDTGKNALAFNLKYTPQSDETASLSTRERYDFGFADRVVIGPRIDVSAALGDVTFTQNSATGNGQSSLYARVAITDRLSPNVSASALYGRDGRVAMDSAPQSKLGIAVQDKLSARTIGDVELGTALNAAGNTKAHYLGFGVSFLR